MDNDWKLLLVFIGGLLAAYFFFSKLTIAATQSLSVPVASHTYSTRRKTELPSMSAELDTLLEISENLRIMLDKMQKTPSGNLVPMNAAVSDSWSVVNTGHPLFKFTIYNDGPNPVYVGINKPQPLKQAPLNSGDSLVVDWDKPCIHKIYLACATGQSANVRIFGTE